MPASGSIARVTAKQWQEWQAMVEELMPFPKSYAGRACFVVSRLANASMSAWHSRRAAS
jgi:hypothetical protein